MQEGLEAAAQLLAVAGKVAPVSNAKNLVLMGETITGNILVGESEIGHAPDPLRRVWIEPEGGKASDAALGAIQQADLIVIGPGSLYTSIIPNFLITEIREAMAATQAPKVFVCNVATQPHETDGYSVADHLKVFQEHSRVAVTHVVVNNNVKNLPGDWNQVAVPSVSCIEGFDGSVIPVDVVDEKFPTRHDPIKLAEVIGAIERSSSRV